MTALGKVKGTFRSLFSIEFAVSALIVVALVSGLGLYFGFLNEDDIPMIDSEFEDVSVNDGTLTVELSDDHGSDVVVLVHEYEEEPIHASETPRFAGSVSWNLEALITCSDADWPTNQFEVVLITIEDSIEDGVYHYDHERERRLDRSN